MSAFNPLLDPEMDPALATSLSPYGGDQALPPQEDVDEFLRKKRKAREHKACYPCRQRKVKCDLSRPCQTCRDRDHPELCSYHPPEKRRHVESSVPLPASKPTEEEADQNAGSVTLGRLEFDLLCRKLNGLENAIADLRREMKRSSPENGVHHDIEQSAMVPESPRRMPTHTDMHGLHTTNESGEIVHLGGGSIPAMLYAFSQNPSSGGTQFEKLQEFLGKSVLPMLGLENESATYPFVDLWGLPHGSLQRARELAKALPNDAQMMTLFRSYCQTGHVIYPGIADINRLESDMSVFMLDRASRSPEDDGVTEDSIYGMSLNWVGMLFAALANGAQCSSMSRKERELTSQVYVCCAFECLRFTNFLSQPHMESIQALLIIGLVMTNNLSAGTAWSLLGLTIRLAQGLGLHQACPPHTSKEVAFERSKVWWAVTWQDSLLSIIYDRNAALDVSTMPMPQEHGVINPYHASMYRMCRVGLDIVRDRARSWSPRDHVARINLHREAISTIMRESAEYLRDSRKCSTTRETLEHWCLYLHASYAMSELCRPAVSPSTANYEAVKVFRQVCVKNLTDTVEAFLGLNNLTPFARQSWAGMHRGLSSALLLGILGEHVRNERARQLIARFISVMTDLTSNADSQVAAPMQRGIEALRRLQIDNIASNGTSEGTDSQTTSPIDASVPNGKNGMHRIDHTQMFTPSNPDTNASEEEYSPYAVLNTILWGNAESYQNPTVFTVP